MTRVAFSMEQSLGNVTHYLNLRAAEDAAPWLDATWLPLDYHKSRLPWVVTGSIDARRALGRIKHQTDAVFIHTTTIGLLSPTLLPHHPLVLSTDGTPDKPGMREWYNLKPEGRFIGSLKRQLYHQVFSRADGFVAWCEWTKTALVQDYGVDADRVTVIPPGVDVGSFVPGNCDNDLPRILFVGGDFQRKGGDLLLDVFRTRLRGRAELVLVTGEDIGREPGITVHRGLTANSQIIHDLYASSDIFALPTRGDMLPVAGTEALASGLPLVVTRVGGLPDLVTDGQTGRLVEVDDAKQFGDALEELVIDHALRQHMATNARLDAEARFDARTNALKLFNYIRSVM